MPMFNLLYCSKKFRKTTESFWNYYPDKPNSAYDNDERDKILYLIGNSESFDYKTKFINNLPGVDDPANGNDVKREL